MEKQDHQGESDNQALQALLGQLGPREKLDHQVQLAHRDHVASQDH